MENIVKLWKQNKIQPDFWFFYCFLLTFTLSVRKVLFYFPIQRTFNEYTAVYLYLSDIFLFLAIISWLIILCYRNIIASRDKLWITYLKHILVSMSMAITRPIVYLPALLIVWAFVSVSWADNKTISLFGSIKLLEFYLLYLYLIYRFIPDIVRNVPRGTKLLPSSNQTKKLAIESNCSTWNKFILIIIIIAVIQSIIGIIQVIIQHSLGLIWLKESIISPIIPGVAKIVVSGQKYIRAYGLFPHPNILGGFLLFSIAMTLLYINLVSRLPQETKMFHLPEMQPQFNSRIIDITANQSNMTESYGISLQAGVEHFAILPGGTIRVILYATLAIQLLSLILTLSKSAILGLIIALLYIYVPSRKKCSTPACPRGRWNIPQGKRGTFCDFTGWNNYKIRIAILCSLIILVSLFLVIHIDLNSALFQSIYERMFYLDVSRGTILAHPIIGVGQGQFVVDMQYYSAQKLQIWQFQPVHNVYLIIWSELGIIGLVIFLAFLYNVFHMKHIDNDTNISSRKECSTWNIPRDGRETVAIMERQEYTKYLQAVLLGFIFLMLWDHYSWDIQQGQAILWILLGFMAGIKAVQYTPKK